MMKWILLLSIFIIQGCGSIKAIPLSDEELLWQSLHTIDMYQTSQFHKTDGAIIEVNPITRKIIGEQPNEGEVLLWAMLISFAHYKTQEFLKEHDYRTLYKIFQFVSIVKVGSVVKSNQDLLNDYY